MNNEEKLLLNLCQCYLDDKSPVVNENIDWKRFFMLAKGHNLIGICHCVFSKNKQLPIPDKIRQLFMDKFFDLVYIYEQQNNALSDIKRCLTGAGIPFIAFKGSVIRNLYPVPESRAMGDIDLLISGADSTAAEKALLKEGFIRTGFNGNVYDYKRNNVVLELHTKIITQFGENAFSDVFDNTVLHDDILTLDDSYHFAYLIAHTANHLKYTGAGIRFIIDLAVMIKNRSIDFQKVFDILDKIGLTAFGEVIISVCFQWFGVGKLFCENTERVQKYMISDGIFGSMKSSIHSTVSRLLECDALENNANKSSPALKIKLAFPPYETLRKAHYIKFLNGKPWLLPAAWIYRIIYNLQNNRSHMLETVKNIDDEKTAALAKEELEFFKEIGLI